MLIRSNRDAFVHPTGSDITPQATYLRRRDWLARVAVPLAFAGAGINKVGAQIPQAERSSKQLLPAMRSSVAGASTLEKPTAYKDATTYNNFYEFGTDKSDPVRQAHRLVVRPWTIVVEGLVNKPGRWDIESLLKLSAQEDRVYRLRCVEAWSMVIPWVGYSMSELIRRVEPQGSAKYVEFHTMADPKMMPGLSSRVLDWPYVEGLRLDEAMHPLTMLAFGMYGEVLPNQNGAPVRVVVPWKYGFKSGKSIVRLRFTEKEPRTSWVASAASEYGFYSNVNPSVDHPRWSQATERRIGEDGLFAKKRATQMFNGYEAQVGQLYAGMDLKKLY